MGMEMDAAVPDRVVMAGNALPARPTCERRSRADSNERVRIVLKLRRKAQPPDPLRRGARFPSERRPALSREEYGSRYGAAPEDVEAVISFAGSHNLRLERRDDGARLVVVSGIVRDAEEAFGTTLSTYESPTGEVYRGYDGDLSIPADVGDRITAVAGLDTRALAQPPHQPPPQPAEGSAARPSWHASELADLYSFPPGLDGSGQTIGILVFGGGYVEADLEEYFGALRPALNVQAVSIAGTPNAPRSNFRLDQEVTLDVEVAGGAAPGASIVVYFAPDTEPGWQEA